MHPFTIKSELNHHKFIPEDLYSEICQETLRKICFISKDKKMGLIENIIQFEDNISFIVRYFRDVEQFYDVGLTSQSVGVFCCSNLSNKLNVLRQNDVEAKCY